MKQIATLAFIGMLFSAGLSFADLLNGGFETGNTNGWTTAGNVEVLPQDSLPFGWQDTDEFGNPVDHPTPYGRFIADPQTQFSPYEGNSMIKIGSHTAVENWESNNHLSQVLTGDYYLPELTFAFNLWSYDYGGFDLFEVGITDEFESNYTVWSVTAGYVEDDREPPTLDYSGWQEMTIDLTPFLGSNASNFVVWFSAGETEDTAERTRTGVYLDGIEVSGSVVPEPTMMFLLFVGGLFLLIRRCKL